MLKRFFDILFSIAGLFVLSPIFAAVAVLIKFDSCGPVFFRQSRVGRYFRPFMIYKFRTMREGAEKEGALVTVGGDMRVTKVGHFLRTYKIDELPQLINVLKGDMSIVGPRPEVTKYVELFRGEYEKLLRIRPGITDPASLRYSREESVLALAGNWQEDYLERILPEKIKLSLGYIENHSIFTDFRLIIKTFLKIVDVR